MSRRIAGCLACLVALACCVASAARADGPALQVGASDAEPPEYRSLIEGALDEYRVQNFVEARALFQHAHARWPNARTLRGMGMAEFELKNYRDSVLRLEAALASPVKRLEGDLRAQTEELLARARQFVARLRVRTMPAEPRDLRMWIDGEPVVFTADHTITVGVGEHVLQVKAEGFREEQRNVSLKGAYNRELLLELRPESQPRTASATARPTERESGRPVYRNPWLWSGIGALIVGGVVAGVVLALRKDSSSGDPYPSSFTGIGGRVQTLEHGR